MADPITTPAAVAPEATPAPVAAVAPEAAPAPAAPAAVAPAAVAPVEAAPVAPTTVTLTNEQFAQLLAQNAPAAPAVEAAPVAPATAPAPVAAPVAVAPEAAPAAPAPVAESYSAAQVQEMLAAQRREDITNGNLPQREGLVSTGGAFRQLSESVEPTLEEFSKMDLDQLEASVSDSLFFDPNWGELKGRMESKHARAIQSRQFA